MGDAVAFDVYASHGGGVEQDVNQVIMQQIDLVDVEHAAVGASQQSRRERVLAVAHHPLQIQRANHPVFGGPQRQLHEAGLGAPGRDRQQRGQPAHRRRFRRALLATDERPTDLRSHGTQQNREPQPIVPDDRAERIRLHGRST